jgi:simple sugar transport system permease protein
MVDLVSVIFAAIATGIGLMPIVLFPAAGETVDQLAGTMNIGMEGMMLFGGIIGYFTILSTHSISIGIAAAMITGAMVATFTAYFVVNLALNQVVFGMGIYLLGLGASSVLYLHYAGASGTVPTVPTLPKLAIPYLSSIPTVGVLFTQNILVYVSWAVLIVVALILDKTWLGLKIRAVGQDPAVADSLGLNVNRYRLLGLILSGTLAAVGGLYIIICVTGLWIDNITNGAGFIAVGIIRVGTWTPWKTFLACLLYATVNGLQYSMQILTHLPPQLFQAIPYMVVIFLLALPKSKERMPKGLGTPYKRE